MTVWEMVLKFKMKLLAPTGSLACIIDDQILFFEDHVQPKTMKIEKKK